MLRIRATLLLALAVLPLPSIHADDWEQQLERRVESLIARHGEGTDKQLKERLRAIGRRDQSVRTPEYFGDGATPARVHEQERVDAELTSELKAIIKEKGWPTVRLVGLPASEDAMLVLTHSRDHDFQRAMLPRLQELAEAGEILAYSVAGLVDKILISEGKPQRFGTQFKWVGHVGEILPVEDPEHIEQRRTKYLLPPLADYKKVLEKTYDIVVR